MLAALSLAACVHAPRPLPPPPVVHEAERTWSDPRLRATLATFGATPAADAPLEASEAFAAALSFSPELAIQRADLDLARAEVMRAKQRPNPVLALSPEHLIQAAAGVSPWVVALSLVWPVRTAGKRALDIEQALATSDAALLSSAGALWGMRTATRDALCLAQLVGEQERLARRELELRIDLAARLRKQTEAGVASRYEAMRAQLDSDQAAQRARRAELDSHAARHELARLIGLPVAQVDARVLDTGCLEDVARAAPSNDALAESATLSRLDLRMKLADFRAADAAWRAELARRVPDLNLGPGYLYDQGDRKITFSIAAELPLFAHNDAAIAKATAQRARVIADIDKLQWDIRAGVARATDQLALARLQLADSERAVAAAEELLARDRARVEQGEIDRPALIASEIVVVNARADRLGAARTLLDALSAAETATQTPLMPPFFGADAAEHILSNAPSSENAGAPR